MSETIEHDPAQVDQQLPKKNKPGPRGGPRVKAESVAQTYNFSTVEELMAFLIDKGQNELENARKEAADFIRRDAVQRDCDLNDVLALPANAVTQKEVEKIIELEKRLIEAVESSRDAFCTLLSRAQVNRLKQTAKTIQEETKKRKSAGDKEPSKKHKDDKADEEQEENVAVELKQEE